MFIVVRKSTSSSIKNKDRDTKLFNDISNPSNNISLDVIEVEDYFEKGKASFNRVYHVFDGELQLAINDQQTTLYKGDGVFIQKGMTYEMKGTFKAVAVNTVATLD